jgi:hypothetical protein
VPTFRDVLSSTVTAGTSLVVTKPSAVVDGDFMVVSIIMPSTRTVSAVPSGWTLAPNLPFVSGGTNTVLYVYTKVAASEGSSWTWTLDASTDALAVAIAYSGQNTATPLNVSGVPITTASATTIASPSITPSVDGCKIVAIYGVDTSVSLFPATPDSSPAATERIEAYFATPSQNMYIQDYDQTTAAAVALDATFTTAGAQIAYALAISPSTAPAVFNVLASGDDGVVSGSGASWPPSASAAPTNGTELFAIKWLNAGTYHLYVPLMRFDTSALPDGATVTAATLRLYIIARDGDADDRSLSAGWYASSNWPIDTGDFITGDATDAHSGTDLTGISAAASLDLALTNLTNISKTDYTGLRLTITGGAPTGQNNITIAAIDHTTSPEAQLFVTYSEGAGAVAPTIRVVQSTLRW